MQLSPGLRHILAETKLFTDAKDYVILRLPTTEAATAAELIKTLEHPFAGMAWDKDDITLVLLQGDWEGRSVVVEDFEESPNYRLITFDLPLDLEVVGYLASLSKAIAEAGVSIFHVSSFSRDHSFVPAEDFDRAWNALRELIRTCQMEETAETRE